MPMRCGGFAQEFAELVFEELRRPSSGGRATCVGWAVLANGGCFSRVLAHPPRAMPRPGRTRRVWLFGGLSAGKFRSTHRVADTRIAPVRQARSSGRFHILRRRCLRRTPFVLFSPTVPERGRTCSVASARASRQAQGGLPFRQSWKDARGCRSGGPVCVPRRPRRACDLSLRGILGAAGGPYGVRAEACRPPAGGGRRSRGLPAAPARPSGRPLRLSVSPARTPLRLPPLPRLWRRRWTSRRRTRGAWRR